MDSDDIIFFHNPAIEAIAESVLEFNIEADDLIDVKRMPPSVVNVNTFLGHLRSIKAQIDADNLAGNTYKRDRDNHIEGTKPAYMLNGSLKRYKLGVCCLHAIHNYLSNAEGQVDGSSLTTVSQQIMDHASRNPPRTLGNGGSKLWTATFSSRSARTQMFIGLIVEFMRNDPDYVADPDDDSDDDDGPRVANSGLNLSDDEDQDDETSEQGEESSVQSSGKLSAKPVGKSGASA